MSLPASSPLRWALVGYGSGGRLFHAPLLASARGIDFAAVVTRDPDRRAAVTAAYPHVRCVDSLAELSSLGIAGISISTPPQTHVPLALEAIERGWHVVVDKPFALNLGETERVVDAARAAGVLALPYFNRRWDDDFRTLRALVDSGSLGAPRLLESRLDRFRPVKPGWSSDAEVGGGLLLDLGPHLVDQALVLLGPAVSVRAELETVREGAGAEDNVILHLTHVSGARSVLTASLAAPAAGPRFLLQAAVGGVRIDGFDAQEAQLKAGGSPASLGAEWGVDRGRWASVSGPDGFVESRPLEPGRWNDFYPAVVDALRGSGSAPTTPESALHVAAVLDAARCSAREARAVVLSK